MDDDPSASFASFFAQAEPRLRSALSGAFGAELGRDAAADALAWAWQNRERLDGMHNPIGYLYRVGRSRALRDVRRREVPCLRDGDRGMEEAREDPDPELTLLALLADLPERQRVAVWMVHGLGYRHSEVASLLGCSSPTVATHVRRGLSRLRRQLEESRV
ncbi:MAG: RNA polymerase sigma factor [Acidimicrobiales bacterium]